MIRIMGSLAFRCLQARFLVRAGCEIAQARSQRAEPQPRRLTGARSSLSDSEAQSKLSHAGHGATHCGGLAEIRSIKLTEVSI